MKILTRISINHPRIVVFVVTVFTLGLLLASVLPSLFLKTFPYMNTIKVDTDPENMLSGDEPARVYHNAEKKEFGLWDVIVVGVVNDTQKNGVFNKKTLSDVYDLVEYAKTISWKDADGKKQGVVEVDVMAPSTVDNIEQAGPGTVRFDWLMPRAPKTEAEAEAVWEKAARLPMLNGTLVSEDGTALAVYIPITAKNISYRVAKKLEKKIAEFEGGDKYYITGLPVAQDTFGVEMFTQMAISAPLAMLLIFILMWFFFRNISVILSPMIVAIMSVISTMGLLVITGNTIHIMSSMIPIFIMPIAVLDSIHIISDFYDKYQKTGDRRKTIVAVMDELSAPMFFTSLTTMAGFGSLVMTPIPPVQTFGLFVAVGVLIAWVVTVMFVPAFIMLKSEKSLAGFGMSHHDVNKSLLARIMHWLGRGTYNHARLILTVMLLMGVVAVYGITKITINDNPVKWFSNKHKIRIADRELNKRFAGTYMAYLEIEPEDLEKDPEKVIAGLRGLNIPEAERTAAEAEKLKNSDGNDFMSGIKNFVEKAAAEPSGEDAKAGWNDALDYLDTLDPYTGDFDKEAVIGQLAAKQQPEFQRLAAKARELKDLPAEDFYDDLYSFADDESLTTGWDKVRGYLDAVELEGQFFKNPESLAYVENLQKYLLDTGLVGKSNSLVDVVKTVSRELYGSKDAFRIPDTQAAVGQTLLQYQNSHRPNDLWKMVTPDYRKLNIWIQLKSGDNKDMNALVKAVDKYFEDNKSPLKLNHNWFGLTYINVIWQEKMVKGMMKAFLGSFVIVLILMVILFRSFLWGLLSMIPLTLTIGIIYGMIGLVGKDYDMPVAVLSSLTLGLAVDYAIHFISRSREMRERYDNWRDTTDAVFGEPARAITRNVIVIGVGFLPLLAAPLVPYKTVGVFISAILLLAGAATLLILPALIKVMEGVLFKKTKKAESNE